MQVAMRGGVTYTSFRDIEAASCTGFGGLDRSTDNVCGFLLEENPDASGTNECECHGFQCVELEGTGTQCKGLRPISYDTLLQLCRCHHWTMVIQAHWLWRHP